MATTVILKTKDEEGNVKRENHEIEDINLMQFEEMMKVIKDIFVSVQEDEALMAVFKETLDNEKQIEAETKRELHGKSDDEIKQIAMDMELDPEGDREALIEDITTAVIENEKDGEFYQNLIKSFDTLAVHLPGQAIRLLSVLSDIEINKLQQQKMLDVMDIYDAVIEENDIEKLVERVKKSLAVTKAKMNFAKVFKKKKKQPALESAQA